jgi:hypothetical protein
MQPTPEESRAAAGVAFVRHPRADGVMWSLARIFTVQDVLLLGYLTITGVMVWASSDSPLQAGCARVVYVSVAAHATACFIARGLPRLPVFARAVVYRASIVGVLVSSYLTLRDFLQLVRHDALDDALVRADLALFGVEPALWLERFNRRPIIEWFSFFYFSYFAICGLYMLVVVWFMRPGRRTTEFAIGTLIVFGLGQLGYTAVPGYGPIKHLASQFHGGIDGGFFWACVWGTVQAGGAMKDIFPSLHTATPLWFAFFALHQARGDRRWLWPAGITAFFSANIIFSTMLLRWHYGVDVLAGLALAVTAGVLAPRLAALEDGWRRSVGLDGPWTFVAADAAQGAGSSPAPAPRNAT